MLKMKENMSSPCRSAPIYWEVLGGMRVWRAAGGRRIYQTKCSKCQKMHSIDGGRLQHEGE